MDTETISDKCGDIAGLVAADIPLVANDKFMGNGKMEI